MVDIKGLDKAQVLAALHNGTICLGMGMLHDIGTCSIEQAQKDIEERKLSCLNFLRFDYYHGRPLKCDLNGDEFNPSLYDRDAGKGVAERIIASLRSAA
jgi:hypothetical protein